MSSARNDYWFVTNWQVEGTCSEVADVLADPLAFPRWWLGVYLDVQELRPAGPTGVGRRVRVHSKGWLPYTLRWEFEVVESNRPHGFTIVATGDFDGRGVWTIEQQGAQVAVRFDWRIKAEKPLLRNLSFLMKPLFEANHRWAMARGRQGLERELAARRLGSQS
jgi:hypothetical protein